jgi:hypothetical protein
MSEPARSVSVSELLDATYARFKRNALKCLPLMMPAVLAVEAADIYWLLTGHRGAKPFDPRDSTFYVLNILGVLAFVWLAGAVVLRMRANDENRLRSIGEDLQESATLWPRLMMTSLLVGALVMIGLFALLLPGIWLIVCATPLYPVVLLERASPVEALKRCIALVKPLWVKVLAALVFAALVVFICLLTVGVILALVLGFFGAENSAAGNAIATTAMLLAATLSQLFFLSLALEVHATSGAHSSASASA